MRHAAHAAGALPAAVGAHQRSHHPGQTALCPDRSRAPLLLFLQLPSADDVEYWRSPDKAGWLQAQSDNLKLWRKRWFVLKQGYLFRFLTADVSRLTQ